MGSPANVKAKTKAKAKANGGPPRRENFADLQELQHVDHARDGDHGSASKGPSGQDKDKTKKNTRYAPTTSDQEQSLATHQLDNNTSSKTGDATNARAMREFHQRVLDRVLLRFPSVKDAFRQYDTTRSGLLSLPQFRTLLRELGFVGAPVEALIRALDPTHQQSISFRAFAATPGKANTEQSYTTAPLPKRKKKIQSIGRGGVKQSSSAIDASSAVVLDPIEQVRGKLRKRVMGRDKSIREVFMEFDLDGNGYLDHDEFREFMSRYQFTMDETELCIEFLDQDLSGTIDYEEFAAGLLFYRPPAKPQALQHPHQGLEQQQRQGNPDGTRCVTEDQDNEGHDSALDNGDAHPQSNVVTVVRAKLLTALRKSSKTSPLHLRDEFKKFGADEKDTLDYEEFLAFLVSMGVKLAKCDQDELLAVIDRDHSNGIEYGQFAALCLDSNINDIVETSTRSALRSTDDDESTNDRKQIEHRQVSEVQRRLKTIYTKNGGLRAVFNKYDTDGSGELDYTELSQLMRDFDFSEQEILDVMKQIDGGKLTDTGDTGICLDYKGFEQFAHGQQQRIGNGHGSPDSTRSIPENTQPTVHSGAFSDIDHLITSILRVHSSLETAFHEHDTNENGEMDHNQFRTFLECYGMRNESDIVRLICEVDRDGNGTISRDEFVDFIYAMPQSNNTERAHDDNLLQNISKEEIQQRLSALRELEIAWIEEVLESHGSIEAAFNYHDHDGDGELDYDRFRELMGQYGISDEVNVHLLLKRLDTDNSKTISREEFVAVFNPQRVAHKRRTIQHAPSSKSKATNVERTKSKVKAVQLRYLAAQWVQCVLKNHSSIKEAFDRFDADEKGELNHEQFKAFMIAFGVEREEDIASFIKRLDIHNSGSIEYEELITIFHDSRAKQKPEQLNPSPSRQHQGRVSKLPPSHHIRSSPSLSPGNPKKTQAAKLRELEVRWIKRALSCHSTIQAAFNEYDRDRSGALDHEEFTHFMKRYGITQKDDIERLILRLDSDGSGTIDFDEFSAVFNPLRCESYTIGSIGFNNGIDDGVLDPDELESVLEIERELASRMFKNTRDLRSAFRKFDLNGNGKLEYKEFRTVLKSYKFPEMEIRKVIRHLDHSVSGFIDYKKFVAGFAPAMEKNGGTIADAGKTGATHGTRISKATAESSNKKNGPAHDASTSSNSTDALKKRLLSKILSTHGTIQNAFRKYDTARRGSLDSDQFGLLMEDHGVPLEHAHALLGCFDTDKSGTIEYEEFLSQFIVQHNGQK